MNINNKITPFLQNEAIKLLKTRRFSQSLGLFSGVIQPCDGDGAMFRV